MFLSGKLIAEAPIYRGNARKTLFTGRRSPCF